jgi:hypothetical protein
MVRRPSHAARQADGDTDRGVGRSEDGLLSAAAVRTCPHGAASRHRVRVDRLPHRVLHRLDGVVDCPGCDAVSCRGLGHRDGRGR